MTFFIYWVLIIFMFVLRYAFSAAATVDSFGKKNHCIVTSILNQMLSIVAVL